MRFENKVAFITGSSSGIGAAAARLFAAEGALVAVVASGNLAKAEAVAGEISLAGGRAWPCVLDVRDAGAVTSVLDQAEAELGPIDILVNSAGVYYPTPIGATTVDELDRMVDINLKGSFNTINAMAPRMQERRSGKIVNLSSVAALTGVRERSLYCATKAAIAQMTKALARELAPFDININAIAPGNTATPMNIEVRTSPEKRDYYEGFKAITPSNTTFSEPEELARLILFLASEEARAMHGALLVMDEGVSTGIG